MLFFCRIVTETVTMCVVQHDGLCNGLIGNGELDVLTWLGNDIVFKYISNFVWLGSLITSNCV